MSPYASARDEWTNHAGQIVEITVPDSTDAQYVSRVKSVLVDRTQSFGEAMERVARIANEWRDHEASDRELERLARLLFSILDPGAAWGRQSPGTQDLFRGHAESLLVAGYRNVA